MKNKTYDILKNVCMRILPALITFYGLVGDTCNIPYTTEVLIIATGFNTMLGAMLGISNMNYKKKVGE